MYTKKPIISGFCMSLCASEIALQSYLRNVIIYIIVSLYRKSINKDMYTHLYNCKNSVEDEQTHAINKVWIGLWCLTLLSTIFQLYRSGKFQ